MKNNLRHAAALALVGWYLMVPPFSNKSVLYDAPLSGWQPILQIYGTRAECEESQQTAIRELIPFAGLTSSMISAVLVSKCISSGDPRLKEPSK